MRSPQELVEVYRGAGRKVTPQRLAVFRALYASTSHPSAESVHEVVVRELPMVSLRTVYSILAELTELGEIHQIDLGTGSSRFDPTVEPHHHLVCTRCGVVRDVSVDHPDVRPAVADDGFRITGTQIVFRGLCATCDGAD